MDVPIINSVEEFKEVYARCEVVMDTIFGEPRTSVFPRSVTILREKFAEIFPNGKILDLGGLIGFSFHPPVRPPYHTILNHLASPENSSQKRLPVLSIDIPSGWDVDSGRQPLKDTEGNTVETFEPEVLLSLTAPKEGVREFKGRHWLGGRFIPM